MIELKYMFVPALPKWTFESKKIIRFISKFIPHNSKVLIPFAGKFRFGNLDNSSYIYNDLNQEIKADHHLDAYLLKDYYNKHSFDVIIADPPYTHYQAVLLYEGHKHKSIVMFRRTVDYLLKPGGIYIELGYNSTGLNKNKAEKIALGVCCLGASHNDILILVQKKYNTIERFIKD